MAGYVRYTAVLDACVLYPAPLRDLLLSIAADGIYRVRWTDRIHAEWTRNLLAKRPDLAPEKLARTVSLMNQVADDCLVQDYDYLIDALTLPDPDDRHVLAAAIVGHADAIVTFNQRDFPIAAVSLHHIEVLHPDDFLVAQYDFDPIRFLSIVKANRQRLRKPPKSADELIGTYELQGLPQTCAILREASTLI
jgi:predicted nucleic acid-binding protein